MGPPLHPQSHHPGVGRSPRQIRGEVYPITGLQRDVSRRAPFHVDSHVHPTGHHEQDERALLQDRRNAEGDCHARGQEEFLDADVLLLDS